MSRSERRRQSGAGKRRKLWLAGAAAAVVLAAGGTAGAIFLFGGPDTTKVSGLFQLADYQTARAGCEGSGGYSDIGSGATVVLTNQDGKILGSTSLGPGSADTDSGTCTYSFEIENVSMEEAQYAVEVTDRGKVVHSLEEMKSDDWSVALSLGD